jgi:hypothetical protein
MPDLAPVYIVSSDHPVLVDRMLATVREAAVPASMRAWNYDVIEGKTTATRVITTCQTLPMMGTHRMVLVRDLAVRPFRLSVTMLWIGSAHLSSKGFQKSK